MLRSPSAAKPSYVYALTGGAMLILATAGIGLAYTSPWGEAIVRDGEEELVAQYGVTELTVTAEGIDENVRYREKGLEGPGITAFRTGFWFTPIAGLLLFGAAITLFSAPSTTLRTARVGAIVGLVGALTLLVAVFAFVLGFSDHHNELERLVAGEDAQVGTGLLGGAAFLGAALVLSMGGAVLGFSDKPAKTPPAKPRAAPCPHCSVSVPTGQAFCGGCGASVS